MYSKTKVKIMSVSSLIVLTILTGCSSSTEVKIPEFSHIKSTEYESNQYKEDSKDNQLVLKPNEILVQLSDVDQLESLELEANNEDDKVQMTLENDILDLPDGRKARVVDNAQGGYSCNFPDSPDEGQIDNFLDLFSNINIAFTYNQNEYFFNCEYIIIDGEYFAVQGIETNIPIIQSSLEYGDANIYALGSNNAISITVYNNKIDISGIVYTDNNLLLLNGTPMNYQTYFSEFREFMFRQNNSYISGSFNANKELEYAIISEGYRDLNNNSRRININYCESVKFGEWPQNENVAGTISIEYNI